MSRLELAPGQLLARSESPFDRSGTSPCAIRGGQGKPTALAPRPPATTHSGEGRPSRRPHSRSRRGRLFDRREQPPDQLGSLPKTPRLGGTRSGEASFDLFQHPRQRDGEGEEGAIEIGGVVHFGSSVRLSRPCQRAALAPGARNAPEAGAGIFPLRVLY